MKKPASISLALASLASLGLLALAAPAALAGGGGWASSGGELFKDIHNPWFVKNTAVARYCVAIDGASISGSESQIRDSLAKAFAFWRKELDKQSQSGDGFFFVGTQSLEEVDCASGIADIRFLFGHGTLSPKELEFLEQPSKYVGVSVRTEYDEEQLRGKGFVYISSDMGPNRYNPDDSNLVERAWSKGNLLQYALMHEIGHIYGFPHVGSGLMSEVFLEQVLQKTLYDLFQMNAIEPVLFPDFTLETCGLDVAMLQWFEAPADTECLKLSFRIGVKELVVEAKRKGSKDAEKVGLIRRILMDTQDFTMTPIVILHLTPKQKVFAASETKGRPFILGPILTRYGARATYVPASGTGPKTAYFQATQDSFTLLGLVKEELKVLFSFRSPLGTQMIFTHF
jgi:hypothetical protein